MGFAERGFTNVSVTFQHRSEIDYGLMCLSAHGFRYCSLICRGDTINDLVNKALFPCVIHR